MFLAFLKLDLIALRKYLTIYGFVKALAFATLSVAIFQFTVIELQEQSMVQTKKEFKALHPEIFHKK